MVELFEQNIRTKDRQSSKGNQLKWENNGIWYKADYTGYEGLAEYVISHLLKKSTLDASGRIGLLSSMFTDPEYRRKGIEKELLSRVVKDAREYGCGTIQITASDMGVKLYTDFGFVHNGNFMQYKL